MLLQWSEDLAVGHPIIDNDHQMLINFANELAHAHQSGADSEAISRALGRFVQYLETHFHREEELFMATDYPHKEKHVQNHRDIEKMFRGFQAAMEVDPDMADLTRLLNFLKEWLVKHIGKLDRSYASYVERAEKKHGQHGQRKGFA